MKIFGKIYRVVAVIFLGLTAVVNVLAGVGTTCAAFFTERFDSMMAIYDYRWMYQVFVLFTVAVGVAGIWATISLIRRRRNAYRNTLIVLLTGTILNGIHYITSAALRGNAAPVNMIFYINLITLVIFGIMRVPGIRDYVTVDGQGDSNSEKLEVGAVAIISGIVVLSTVYWAGPTHMVEGQNWVLQLIVPLLISGCALLTAGIGSLVWAGIKKNSRSSQIQLDPAVPVLPEG